MDAFTGLHIAKGTYNPVQLPEYKERVSYDANVNIKTYIRNGDKARLNMDSLLYIYQPNNNQLTQVLDYMPDNNLYNDLKSGQVSNNYTYDAIGNLVSDRQEGINDIKWNVYGKISAIQKNSTTINYLYDASGNRVMKQTPTDTVAYVRDASGNVLSVYTKNKNGLVQQSETYLYGSSRLGVVRAQRVAPKTMKLNTSFNDAKLGVFTRGEKMYELSNHLQNVLTTVSDKRLPVTKSNDTVVNGYNAVVMSASDYYPFGMEMVGRNVNTNTYRYGASSGQEKSTEINANSYTAEYWQYDSRIGRRWNVDIVKKEFESGYATYGNNPILNVDNKGDDWYKYKADGDKFARWHWQKGHEDKIKIGVDDDGHDKFLTTQKHYNAMVHFDGYYNEKLGSGNNLYSNGAKLATVTVFNEDGERLTMKGFTMSSNANLFGVVKDGDYNVNWDAKGKSGKLKSHWAVNGREAVPDYRGHNPNTRKSYLTGVFIHSSNKSGFAGAPVSKGCLLVAPKDWNLFNKSLEGTSHYRLMLRRK